MTWEDAWFVILLAFITIWGSGFYWWGYIYGKEKGEQIAKDTKHACQLEIERVKKEAMEWREWSYTLSGMEAPRCQVVDFTEHKNVLWFLNHAQRKAASRDSDAG